MNKQLGGGLSGHVHAEIYGGEKPVDADGWSYYRCDTCGYRWRTKTITEGVPQPPKKERLEKE